MSVALLCVAGVALDALLGEPRRWHPLVAFGLPCNVIQALQIARDIQGQRRALVKGDVAHGAKSDPSRVAFCSG